MNLYSSRLVLRRKAGEKGSMVAIRLAENVDRTADLYSLLVAGITVEVIDIEIAEDDQPFVTLGFRAPEAFRIDRIERILQPRNAIEIGEESHVRFEILTHSEAEEVSDEAIDARLANVRDAQRIIQSQLKRLKRDKSKASQNGFHRKTNKEHHQWLLIVEELDVLTDQLNSAKASAAQLVDIQKTRRTKRNTTRYKAFSKNFLRLAKEKLPIEIFEELCDVANRITDADEVGQDSVGC